MPQYTLYPKSPEQGKMGAHYREQDDNRDDDQKNRELKFSYEQIFQDFINGGYHNKRTKETSDLVRSELQKLSTNHGLKGPRDEDNINALAAIGDRLAQCEAAHRNMFYKGRFREHAGQEQLQIDEDFEKDRVEIVKHATNQYPHLYPPYEAVIQYYKDQYKLPPSALHRFVHESDPVYGKDGYCKLPKFSGDTMQP